MIKPTPEQFEEWRANPVTEWLMNAFLTAEMRRTKAAYQHIAWERYGSDAEHRAYRERHDTLEWLQQLDMPTIEATLTEQE